MILLNGNKLSHRLVQDLTAQTTREHGVNRWSRNDNWNVSWAFRGSLLRRTWLGISFKVQRMVQRLISILELRLSSINLGRMTSVFLQLESSEPNSWEVTSAWVQKHNLSTMLSKQANNDLFLLRSDSKGIRTLPGTEGRRIGSASGR